MMRLNPIFGSLLSPSSSSARRGSWSPTSARTSRPRSFTFCFDLLSPTTRYSSQTSSPPPPRVVPLPLELSTFEGLESESSLTPRGSNSSPPPVDAGAEILVFVVRRDAVRIFIYPFARRVWLSRRLATLLRKYRNISRLVWDEPIERKSSFWERGELFYFL